MATERTFAERWEQCQARWDAFVPSKPLWFWSCVGTAALTIIVGFTAGGWMTRGVAEKWAQQAAEDARVELVAIACVRKFSESPNFEFELSMLKDAQASSRAGLLEKGGWVTLPGMNEPLAAAAVLCAGKLAKLDHPPVPISGSPSEPST